MPPKPRPHRLEKLMTSQAAPEGGLFKPMCPSRTVLDHVTSRWGVLVLVALQGRTLRFSELRRTVPGVSEKMLAQTLQLLEGDGFVLRKVFPVIPPRVDYSLTSLGDEVAERVGALTDWIGESLGRILEARAQHEARKPAGEG